MMNKNETIDFLAQFVVYNAWLGDKKDFKKIMKNAKQYLLETEWKKGD